MKTLHYILVLILFAAGLLLGVQIPNFVDQYEKRIDAHYIEATENFKGFDEIAKRFHNGNVEELIRKHEESIDSTFNAEAAPLRKAYERKLRFEREYQAMQTSLFGKVKHIALEGDREIMEETYLNYSPNVPLDTSAIIWGLSSALAVIIIFELVILFFKKLFTLVRRISRPARST